MITLRKITQSAPCETHHNTWHGSHYSASSTAPKLTTACRWQTNVRWKCLHSIWLAEPLHTKDLHKFSAYLCLLFQCSCASTWTQLSTLTNALNTWTTLESKQIMLRILAGIYGLSLSVLTRQD